MWGLSQTVATILNYAGISQWVFLKVCMKAHSFITNSSAQYYFCIFIIFYFSRSSNILCSTCRCTWQSIKALMSNVQGYDVFRHYFQNYQYKTCNDTDGTFWSFSVWNGKASKTCNAKLWCPKASVYLMKSGENDGHGKFVAQKAILKYCVDKGLTLMVTNRKTYSDGLHIQLGRTCMA